MFFKKKITVAGTLVALVVLGIAASAPADPIFKNLKVLPKNTTHEQLDSVMHMFNSSLGVKCGFCHAAQKDNPKKLDFASDEKGEKGAAREMMKMTLKINKKFFQSKHPYIGDSTLAISCFTCHHGQPHPGEGGGNNEQPRRPEGQRPPAPPAQGGQQQ